MRDFFLKAIYWTGIAIAFLLPFPLALAIAFNLYYVWNAPLWICIAMGVIMLAAISFAVGKLIGKW